MGLGRRGRGFRAQLGVGLQTRAALGPEYPVRPCPPAQSAYFRSDHFPTRIYGLPGLERKLYCYIGTLAAHVYFILIKR